MKYNVKANEIAKALYLADSQVNRLEQVMSDALDKIGKNSADDFSFNEISALVAPHVFTPEEAWYCAFGLSSMLNHILASQK